MTSRRLAPVIAAALLFIYGICAKPPDVPDRPWGQRTGMQDVPYACSTQTTDPAGGQVSYQFDWGDGSQSDWSALMDGGQPCSATHTYTQGNRTMPVRARARTAKGKASAWSEPFDVFIRPAEGTVVWSFAFIDPDDPDQEDSADFSTNTFGVTPGDTAYIGCDLGAVVGRGPSGGNWDYFNWDYSEFLSAAVIGDDGTVYVGNSNDTLYALYPDLTVKWIFGLDDGVSASPALGAGGAVFVQSEGESLYALTPGGGRSWAYATGGGKSSPVVGPDGTVYAASQEGVLHALDPSDGGKKWEYAVGSQQIDASPALDTARDVIYVVDEDGRMAAVYLADGSEKWQVTLGPAPSSPVIAPDGSIIVGVTGRLLAVHPETRAIVWQFEPPLAGSVSTPAVSAGNRVYALVSAGKRDVENPDSLYGLNVFDGSRLWACALGEGFSDEYFSAPKIGADGSVYIGSGLTAWCVGGLGGPAPSPWPMFQHDARNTGRVE